MGAWAAAEIAASADRMATATPHPTGLGKGDGRRSMAFVPFLDASGAWSIGPWLAAKQRRKGVRPRPTCKCERLPTHAEGSKRGILATVRMAGPSQPKPQRILTLIG